MTVVWQPTLANLQAAISGIPLVFVQDAGTGYDAPVSVAISAPSPGGVQAVANAVMGVGAVNVFAGGFGYTKVPNVVFVPGFGGTGATATAVLTPFTVDSVSVTSPGSGYTSAPKVQFSGGGGTGAAGFAVLSGGVITSVTLASGGAGYMSAPTVSISGGGGIGAVVTCTMASLNGSVSTATLTGTGSNYSSAPDVSASGGSGAVFQVYVDGSISTITTNAVAIVGVATPAGYSPGSSPNVTISAPDLPGGTQATATALVPSSPVVLGDIAITIVAAGSGYSGPPTVTIDPPDVPGPGANAAVATTVLSGPLSSTIGVVIVDGGSGYTTGSLSFTGGGGTGATGTFVVQNNTVKSVQIVSGGTGYTDNPTVTFVGGSPGTAAQAAATASPVGVSAVNVTGPGSGYLSSPTLQLIGGGGSGASGTVTMNPTTVASVTVTNPGSGYTSPPEIEIVGGTGLGARATCTLEVVGFDVTNGGYLYGVDPFPTVTLTASDGVGSGATAIAGLALALISGDLFSLEEASAIATELAGIGAEYDAGIPVPVTQRVERYVAPLPVNWFEVDKATRFAASVSSAWFSWPASWDMIPYGGPNIVMMRANFFNNALQVFESGLPDQFITNTWQPLFDLAVPAYAYFVVSSREATAATTAPFPDNSELATQLQALVVTANELTTYLNTP